jgi:hypothetical protein
LTEPADVLRKVPEKGRITLPLDRLVEQPKPVPMGFLEDLLSLDDPFEGQREHPPTFSPQEPSICDEDIGRIS